MNTKTIRSDLNDWHIAARAGSLIKIKELVSENYDINLLLEKNRAGWFPINLAKNKETAIILLNLMNNNLSSEILNKSLWNNAESIQTKYGNDLKYFLMEKKYKEVDKLAIEPTYEERLSLSKFWLNLAKNDIEIKNDNYENYLNPIELAVASSNSFFIQAIFELNEQNYIKILKQKNMFKIAIGEFYFRKDFAYKVFQYIYQNLNLKLRITNKGSDYNPYSIVEDKELVIDPLKNLEGF